MSIVLIMQMLELFCSNSISNRVNTSTGEITDDTYWDELTVTVEITDANGNVVKSETWNMDKWYSLEFRQ